MQEYLPLVFCVPKGGGELKTAATSRSIKELFILNQCQANVHGNFSTLIPT